MSELDPSMTAKSLRGGSIMELQRSGIGMGITCQRSGHTVHERGFEDSRAYGYMDEDMEMVSIGGQALAGSLNPRMTVGPPCLSVIEDETNINIIAAFTKDLLKTHANPRFEDKGELWQFSRTLCAVVLSDIYEGMYAADHRVIQETMNATSRHHIRWDTAKEWGRLISEDFNSRKSLIDPTYSGSEQIHQIQQQLSEAVHEVRELKRQNESLVGHFTVLNASVKTMMELLYNSMQNCSIIGASSGASSGTKRARLNEGQQSDGKSNPVYANNSSVSERLESVSTVAPSAHVPPSAIICASATLEMQESARCGVETHIVGRADSFGQYLHDSIRFRFVNNPTLVRYDAGTKDVHKIKGEIRDCMAIALAVATPSQTAVLNSYDGVQPYSNETLQLQSALLTVAGALGATVSECLAACEAEEWRRNEQAKVTALKTKWEAALKMVVTNPTAENKAEDSKQCRAHSEAAAVLKKGPANRYTNLKLTINGLGVRANKILAASVSKPSVIGGKSFRVVTCENIKNDTHINVIPSQKNKK